MTARRRKMVAASMGDCVHVAGIINFLKLAQLCGWETKFWGPQNRLEDCGFGQESAPIRLRWDSG